MTRTCSLAAAIALLSLALILPMPTEAQTRDASLQSIRAAVTQTIGAEDASVEVSIIGNVLTVARVNSSLNQTSHSNRDSEASRIAPIVSKAIADKLEFKTIHTIRVVYLVRSKLGGAAKAIDTVDFRKDPSGVFLFHTT